MASNLTEKLSLVPDARTRSALKAILDGLPTALPMTVSLGTPALGDADYLIKAATSTELPNNATITYLATATDASPHDAAAATTTIKDTSGQTVTVWDVRDGATYGRTLDLVATHSSSLVAMTTVISGYDWIGQPMSALYTTTATGTEKTVAGAKCFAYVKSVAFTSAGNATTNTINIGTGAYLGLPYAMEKKGHMIAATIGGVQELVNVASNATVYEATTTTATTSTGDVRGRITFTTSLDGSAEPIVTYYVAARGTDDLHGVVQA